MTHFDNSSPENSRLEIPPCPIFGQCGGCQYQDISYTDELRLKERQVRELLSRDALVPERAFRPIIPSPKVYHYRCRLDLKLLKTRGGEIFVGFSPSGQNCVVEASTCAIALPAISEFLPELKRQARERLPAKYRNANLVVKSGDDGRVAWGGIGRGSLRMNRDDYLWTLIDGKKVYFSLDTFFQANLSILPALHKVLLEMIPANPNAVFYDLYGGVGLFSVLLAARVGKVILIEENAYSCDLARFNFQEQGIACFEIWSGRLEQEFARIAPDTPADLNYIMIDPPRMGLSPAAAELLATCPSFQQVLYLSCHPETLRRDLLVFCRSGWEVRSVIPFDFFPRTAHIEILVELRRAR